MKKNKPLTPADMARKGHKIQRKKYGGKKGYKLEMKRRGLLGVEKRKLGITLLEDKTSKSKIKV